MTVLLYERRPPIAVITLNRPEALNAMNSQLIEAFGEAMADFNGDPSLKAAVLAGAGRAFSAGHDTKEPTPRDAYGGSISPLGGMHKILEPFTFKPLVGAIQGWCVGHGLDWALHCDALVASEDAMLSLPEVRIGLSAGFVWDNMPHVSSTGNGMQMLLTGDPISAKEAYRLGIVQEVVPIEALMSAATSMAESFTRLDTDAAEKIKRVAYFWRNLLLGECGKLGSAYLDAIRAQRERPAGSGWNGG